MVFSIVKQSLDIRLSFPHTPKMTADTECAAAIWSPCTAASGAADQDAGKLEGADQGFAVYRANGQAGADS